MVPLSRKIARKIAEFPPFSALTTARAERRIPRWIVGSGPPCDCGADYRRITMKVAGCFSPRWALPALFVGFALLPVVATAQTAAARQVTFTKDVAPIFNRS